MLEMGQPCIVGPDLAAPPRANIEDVIKDRIDHTPMTNCHDGLTMMTIHHILDKQAHPRAEVHIGFTKFMGQNRGGKGARRGPILGIASG